MSVRRVASLAEMQPDLDRVLAQVGYATMVTVDARHRPRTRVLIATWDLAGPAPVGWLVTFPTRVKTAHLAANPHVSLSYWSPRQDTASFDGTASWVDDLAVKQHAWRLFRDGSPPGVGYDPAAFWTGPDDERLALLRIDPTRVQLLLGRELAAGVPARQWRSPDAAPTVRM